MPSGRFWSASSDAGTHTVGMSVSRLAGNQPERQQGEGYSGTGSDGLPAFRLLAEQVRFWCAGCCRKKRCGTVKPASVCRATSG